MSRRFITGILSISALVATLSAAPARAADPDDVARFLGAAATLFIIGKAIESHSRDKAPARKPGPVARHADRPVLVDPGYAQRRHEPPHRPALPTSCLREVTGANTRYVMVQACLERSNIATRTLPTACRMEVQGYRHVRSAYSVRCLRQRGYELARH